MSSNCRKTTATDLTTYAATAKESLRYITPELVASHGLKPDEYERILKLIGRGADFHRARHLLGHVERALLVQILAHPSEGAADQGAVGALQGRARMPA
jgi:hypothetical protein